MGKKVTEMVKDVEAELHQEFVTGWLPPPVRPKVVCLCGSTRFKDHFIKANYLFTKAGVIVLTVGWFSHDLDTMAPPTPEEKQALDQLHLRKIDLADEVIILDVGGYIGESTQREVKYAIARGIPVYSYMIVAELHDIHDLEPVTLQQLTKTT